MAGYLPMRALPLIAALLLCSPLAVLADESQSRRDSFESLLAAAERGQLHSHDDALADLDDYPLTPYLHVADLNWRLRHHTGPELDSRIRDFLMAHRDLPPTSTLRHRWLKNLADRGRWQELLDQARPEDGTELRCLAHIARVRTQAAGEAELIAQGLEFWRVGRSQPDACDPVFAWLEARGALTPDVIGERARLAIENGNHGLARYLGRKLEGESRDRVDRWLHIVRNPGDLRHAENLDGDIAVIAFKRLALRDLAAAAGLADTLASQLELNADQRHEMERYVALLYAQDHDRRALAWFERLSPAAMDDFSHGWRVRCALYHGRWELALEWIRSLPDDLRAEEEWRYWRARALAATGREAEAKPIFADLAGERSYHGYLAADALEQPYNLNRQPLSVDPEIRQRLLDLPPIQRARELFALDMRHYARAEWRRAMADLDSAELRQAALLAHQRGWHQRAVITLVQADYWDDLDIRYPLIHREIVERAAETNGVDPAYILAIIRTESLFAPDARSSAGALGLMQLLPPTARRVAFDGNNPSTEDLFTPEINIQLGSRYLSAMRQRFDGHPALASAAYNAGPARVEDWLPERTVPADLWIANIPYTETREYVQRAMSHMTVFEARLGGRISRLGERLPAVPHSAGDCRPALTC